MLPRRRAEGDQLTPLARSKLMGRIGPKDTTPELVVRRLLHRLGYRFRLHRGDLPGTPDIVFQGRRKVIFVHGCFWHRHSGCKAASTPKTRVDFWLRKFRENVARDAKSTAALEAEGWDVAIVWSCEIRDVAALAMKLSSFLGPLN
jgi:DNA mismatch endonuclease, patch repair protein